MIFTATELLRAKPVRGSVLSEKERERLRKGDKWNKKKGNGERGRERDESEKLRKRERKEIRGKEIKKE